TTHGEGRTYLGSTQVTTDGTTGDVSFTFHPATLAVGDIVTATATSTGALDSTSEFSACALVVSGNTNVGDIQFTSATYSVSESGPVAAITLTRVGGTNGQISTSFTTSDGSASAGSDYTDSDPTVTLNEGETSKTINVPITDDGTFEGDETVNLALGSTVLNAPQTINVSGLYAATLTIQENDVLSIAAHNATAGEPPSGSTPMFFTVTLSVPAQGTVTVNYATADQPPAISHAVAGACGGGGDYVAKSGTLTFAPGERIKTVAVDICSDAAAAETNETFEFNLSTANLGNISQPQGIGTITTANPAGAFLISEIRTQGPAGPGDDFVELYNNSNSPLTIADGTGIMDASHGYGVFKMGASCDSTPVLIGVIPNGTVIPGRGHYLFVGSQYSLANYGGSGGGGEAAGDAPLIQDIEADRNVAVFSTADLTKLDSITRLDAIGFSGNGTGVCQLMQEGLPQSPTLGSSTEHSFFRKLCDAAFVEGAGCSTPGFPKDTNSNDVDFMFANVEGTVVGSLPLRLGAPGPENLAKSPIRRDATVNINLLDTSQPQSVAPNRQRDLTSVPSNHATFGTLSIRRRVANNTGGPVTRLRFRIVELTSYPSPGGGRSDVRALSSNQIVVSGINDPVTCGANPMPCSVTVEATTLEQPPNQLLRGGS